MTWQTFRLNTKSGEGSTTAPIGILSIIIVQQKHGSAAENFGIGTDEMQGGLELG